MLTEKRTVAMTKICYHVELHKSMFDTKVLLWASYKWATNIHGTIVWH